MSPPSTTRLATTRWAANRHSFVPFRELSDCRVTVVNQPGGSHMPCSTGSSTISNEGGLMQCMCSVSLQGMCSVSLQAAAIAKKAHKEGSTLKESALALGYCTEVSLLYLHQVASSTLRMLLLWPCSQLIDARKRQAPPAPCEHLGSAASQPWARAYARRCRLPPLARGRPT